MTPKGKVAYVALVSVLAAILGAVCYLIGLTAGILVVAAAAAVAIIYGLKLRVEDFILILLPVMFYMNIGGTVNTSVSDFLLLVWAFGYFRKRKFREIDPVIDNTRVMMTNYAAIFIGVMVLSLVNLMRWRTPMLLQAGISIFKIVICFLYALFALDYLKRFGRERFLCIMAYGTVGFAILMIVGVAAYTVGIDLGLTFPGTFRATGTFEDPNLAAAYMFLMTSFALVYFSEKKNILFLAGTCVLSFCAVFLTASKGALVAGICGLSFILLTNLIRGKVGMFFRLLAIYALVAVVVYVLYQYSALVRSICEPVFNRLEEFTDDVEGDHSLAHRSFLWKTAFQVGMTEPILGAGVEQFRTAATEITGQTVWNIVHNTYLTFFSELGIMGLVAFFWLWVRNLRDHFLMVRESNNSVFYVFSILCVSVSMWSISLGNFRSLWIFMAFVLYETNRTKYQKEEEQKGGKQYASQYLAPASAEDGGGTA